MEYTNRPHLPSPRPQHLQSSSLSDETMANLKEPGTTPEPDAASATRSDPEVDTTKLPAGHPVFKIGRAKRYFKQVGKLPPFVIRSRRSVTKLAIVPSTDGLRPENATRLVEMVFRHWDREYSFWTMDQNGRRYIVQHFATDGGQWQTWKRKELFSRSTLAVSSVSRPHPTQENDLETETESYDEPSDDRTVQRYLPSGRPLRSCVSISQDAWMAVDTTSAKSKNLAKDPSVDTPSVPSEVSAASDTATFLKGQKHVELPYRDDQAKMGMASGQDAEHGPSNPPTLIKAPSQLGTPRERLVERSLETRPRNSLKRGLRPNFSNSPTRSDVSDKGKEPDLSILPSHSAPSTLSLGASTPNVTSTPASVAEPQTMPEPALNAHFAAFATAQVNQLLPAPLQPSKATAPAFSEYKRRNTFMALYLDISGQLQEKGRKSLRYCIGIEAFLEVICRRCNISKTSIASVTARFPCLEDKPRRQVIPLDQNVGFIGSQFDEVDNASLMARAEDSLLQPHCNDFTKARMG